VAVQCGRRSRRLAIVGGAGASSGRCGWRRARQADAARSTSSRHRGRDRGRTTVPRPAAARRRALVARLAAEPARSMDTHDSPSPGRAAPTRPRRLALRRTTRRRGGGGGGDGSARIGRSCSRARWSSSLTRIGRSRGQRDVRTLPASQALQRGRGAERARTTTRMRSPTYKQAVARASDYVAPQFNLGLLSAAAPRMRRRRSPAFTPCLAKESGQSARTWREGRPRYDRRL